jgi:hypothetical protein
MASFPVLAVAFKRLRLWGLGIGLWGLSHSWTFAKSLEPEAQSPRVSAYNNLREVSESERVM